MNAATALSPDALPAEEPIVLAATPAVVAAGERTRLTIGVAEPHLLRLLGATVRLVLPEGAGAEPGTLELGGREGSSADVRTLCAGGLAVDGVDALWTAGLDVLVDPATADGSVLGLRAELHAGADSALGAATAQVFVRARPGLDGPRSVASLAAHPEDSATLLARIDVHNAGPSAAREVAVRVPPPDGCVLIADPGGEDPNRGPVPLGGLAPGTTATLRFRAAVVDAPRSGVVGWSGIAVACADAPEHVLGAVPLDLTAFPGLAARFDDGGTALCAEPGGPLAYGEPVMLRLRARNAGPAPASELALRLVFPPGLRYAPGSGRLCGVPLPAQARAGDLAVRLARLAPGETAEVEALAHVVARRDETLVVRGELRWGSDAVRTFAIPLAVAVGPRFPASSNGIEATGLRDVEPGESIEFVVRLRNASPAAAPATAVVLDAEGVSRLELDRTGASGARLEPDGVTLAIGTLPPWASRTLRLCAVAETPPACARVALAGRIVAGGREQLALPAAAVALRVAPRLLALRFVRDGDAPLRPGDAARLYVAVENAGSAAAERVRVAVDLPPGLALDDGGAALELGDLAARETREASAAVRVAGATGQTLAVRGRIEADGVFPTPLPALWIATCAHADFDASTLALAPAPLGAPATVVPGASVTLLVSLTNSGDGTAERVSVRARPLETALYVAGSTTVDGHAMIDRGGGVYGGSGLIFDDVPPGTTIALRWRLHVCGTTGDHVAPRVEIVWDAKRRTVLAAPPLAIAGDEETASPPLRLHGLDLRSRRATDDAACCAALAAYLDETDDGTFARHVLSVRALVAEPGADDAVEAERAVLREAVRDVLDRLAIKLRIPELLPTPRDLEDRALRDALAAFLEPGAGAAVRALPLGSPRAFVALAECVDPPAIASPRLASAHAAYAEALRAAFAAADPDPEAFARALRGPSPAGLDRLRAELVAALRADAGGEASR